MMIINRKKDSKSCSQLTEKKMEPLRIKRFIHLFSHMKKRKKNDNLIINQIKKRKKKNSKSEVELIFFNLRIQISPSPSSRKSSRELSWPSLDAANSLYTPPSVQTACRLQAILLLERCSARHESCVRRLPSHQLLRK